MKKLTLICIAFFILSACSKQIVIWNAKDIIGIGLLVLMTIAILVYFLIGWIKDKIIKKRKNNEN